MIFLLLFDFLGDGCVLWTYVLGVGCVVVWCGVWNDIQLSVCVLCACSL